MIWGCAVLGDGAVGGGCRGVGCGVAVHTVVMFAVLVVGMVVSEAAMAVVMVVAFVFRPCRRYWRRRCWHW